MLDEIFSGIFESTANVITPESFIICLIAALLFGLIIAAAYAYKSKHTRSFLITLGILPAIVCVVIMMVNGKIGAGVAVAGAFSLVRFRSVPGSAREIAALFLAMGTGLIVGMGYITYALIFTVVMSAILLLCNLLDIRIARRPSKNKRLRITIPEDLDYTGVFEDLFDEFTSRRELVKVKTVNMGSMFRLTYDITLRETRREKEFIDRLRERNGNLEVMISREEGQSGEL